MKGKYVYIYIYTLEAQLPIYWVPVLGALYKIILSITQEPTIWVPGLPGYIYKYLYLHIYIGFIAFGVPFQAPHSKDSNVVESVLGWIYELQILDRDGFFVEDYIGEFTKVQKRPLRALLRVPSKAADMGFFGMVLTIVTLCSLLGVSYSIE